MQPPYYPGPTPGYPAPPPAPKRGLSPIFIVLILVGCVGFLSGAVAFAISVGRSTTASGSTADPSGVRLSESYATPNGLLTAHYPADFAAKTLDHATLVLSRNFGGGEDEVVTLAAVKTPITNDVHEFARILDALVEKNVLAKGGTYEKTGHRPTTCLGNHPGFEIERSFKLPTVGPYVSKACFFLTAERGYEVRYDVPRSRSAHEVVLLERIIDATVLAP
jgi:hypothetical protein